MENRNGHKGLGRRQILKNAGAVTATAALVSAVRTSCGTAPSASTMAPAARSASSAASPPAPADGVGAS